MKFYLSFFFLGISLSLFSQKEQLYFNDDLVQITKKEYDKILKKEHCWKFKYKKDKVISNVALRSTIKGKLSKEDFESLRSSLAVSSGKTIAKDKYIAIHYYSGMKGPTDLGNKEFVKNKIENLFFALEHEYNSVCFNIYKVKKGLGVIAELDWYPDTNQFIEKNFFSFDFECSNYILFDPEGNYRGYRGEWDSKGVIFDMNDFQKEKKQQHPEKIKPKYYNDDLDEISQMAFDELVKNEPVMELEFDIEGAPFYVAAKYKKNGVLSSEELANVRSSIYQSSGFKIPEDQPTIIHYYPGPDDCNSGGDKISLKNKLKQTAKNLSKKYNSIFLNFYKNPMGLEELSNLGWFFDSNGVIESTFFPLHYPCSSYVVIAPDGRYISQRGEHNKDLIYRDLEALIISE